MEKKTSGIIISIIVVILLIKFGSGLGNSGVKYNNQIINQQKKIIDKMNNLESTFTKTNRDSQAMDAKLLELEEQIEKSLAYVNEMEAYEGDSSLKDAAIVLFEFYQSITRNEFQSMIDILKLDQGEITQSDIDYLTQIEQDITKRESDLITELDEIQQKFAGTHGFKIEKK
jgi:hypothetical protein